MTRYAEGTKVASERSRNEIERTLTRYGATQFAYGWSQDSQMIGFVAHDRQVRLRLPLPQRNEFDLTPTGKRRTRDAAQTAYDQEVRRRWRALLLIIKAKLEAVSSGIVTFEEEFLAHTVLPSGQSVSEWLEPQIEHSYSTQEMPALLPGSRREIEAAR